VFGALLHHVKKMVSGERKHPPGETATWLPGAPKVLFTDIGPMAVCSAALLVLGIRIPLSFVELLQRAMAVLS
jgi:hypothetical protein